MPVAGRSGASRLGYLYILTAATLWGMLGPLARLLFAEGVHPMEIGFWRAALAFGLFAAHAGTTRRWRVAPRDLPSVALFGLIGIAGLYGFFFLAVRAGGAALASVLLYTAPAWVALAAWAVLRERMSAAKVVAIAATLVGVVLVGLGAGGAVRVSPAALGWGLAAGWSYALYYLLGKRLVERYDAATVFLYALPIGALVLAPFATITVRPLNVWLLLGAAAVLSTYVAYIAYGAGVVRLEGSRAAVVATIEPVVAAFLGIAVFAERLGLAGYVGAVVIVAGAGIAVSERRLIR